MQTIKFSHEYFKMPIGYEISTLLETFIIERSEMSDSFYDYDTTYAIDFNETARYPLPDGKLIVILLKSKAGLLWTTVRRWTPEKEEYYRGLRGENVKIEVKK
jgi:hypothetical protein